MEPQVSSSLPVSRMARMIREDLKDLRDSWLWFFLLGAALIMLGTFALGYSLVATLATALIVGYFLLAGGLFYIVGAFFTLGWGGFFLSLLAGVLYLAAGFIIVNHPTEAALLYTLLLAVFFFVEGLFRIIAALTGEFRSRGWVLFSGVVTLLLGILIWRQWPSDGLWVIGTFIGINLIISGWSYVILGLNARTLPA